MSQFRYKFNQFMQGRYGTDQLYYALLVIYLVLLVFNMFFRRIYVFNILSWAVVIYAFYRVFSRNLYQREKENMAFLHLWDKVRGVFGGSTSPMGGRFTMPEAPDLMARMKDFPSKKYTECPHCHAMLRVPRQRGKHTVRCPRCGQRFSIHIIVGSK